MDQIFPNFQPQVDPVDLYMSDRRDRLADQPWVLLNMVAGADGATAVGGTSTALGGPGDRAVFRAIRGSAEVILVGAGTVRAEQYRPVKLPDDICHRRQVQGRARQPAIAVVSGSLHLDPDAALFQDPGVMIFTGSSTSTEAENRLSQVAEVIRTEGERVKLKQVLAVLAERGYRVVLAEGGPSLNAALAEAGAIDELCLTIAGSLQGGDSSRIIGRMSELDPPRPLCLRRVLIEDDTLFLRYLTE